MAAFISFVLAILTIVLLNICLPDEGSAAPFLINKINGKVDYIAVQNLMWVVFYLGLAELSVRYFFIRSQEKEDKKVRYAYAHSREKNEDADASNSESERPSLLMKRDMAGIYTKVAPFQGILAEMLKSLALHYQAVGNLGTTQSLLEAEREITENNIEQGYNFLRYAIWLLPTLGFIGTVWGILLALQTAAQGGGQINIPAVVADMSMAFWTTLLALLMSSVIMFLMHIIQGREEIYLNNCYRYCIKNFISCLYVHK